MLLASPQYVRQKRYTLAEQSLKNAFKHSESVQPASRELQIRALKQATEMLTSRARDAQERIETLRSRLSDRQVDPSVFAALQQERWKEEKRQAIIQEEVMVLQKQLQSLATSATESATPTVEERRLANLARFLQTSASPRSTYTRRRMSIQTPVAPRLLPLSLSTNRPHSADKLSRAQTGKPAVSIQSSISKRLLSPILPSKSSPSLRSPSLSSSSTSHESSPQTVNTDFSPRAPWFSHNNNSGGTVTIFRDSVQVYTESNLVDLHVDMPDYARNLIDEFVTCVAPHDLPLSPPLPSPSRLPGAPSPSEGPFTPLASPEVGTATTPQSTPNPPTPNTPSRLRKRLSRRSSLFSIHEAISSRMNFVGDHLTSSFSHKPSLPGLRSPQPSVLQTVGEVDDTVSTNATTATRVSFASRIKRKVLRP
ncbi:hypothetical protein BDN71DRAFT_1263174 [Pleurotus eryngii]|uniref:Uncharacterized protein n=1 Tax=Pleurotus eryngii TaxID=5323 RepID=A0A9P6A5N4_PLEER|nr:hypothetical protein BDN71DRAFT_1263174 [Pleurotus eryngii]